MYISLSLSIYIYANIYIYINMYMVNFHLLNRSAHSAGPQGLVGDHGEAIEGKWTRTRCTVDPSLKIGLKMVSNLIQYVANLAQAVGKEYSEINTNMNNRTKKKRNTTYKHTCFLCAVNSNKK